jgi:hypothetical protein
MSSVVGVACFEFPMTLFSQKDSQPRGRIAPLFFLAELDAKKLLELRRCSIYLLQDF